MKVKGHHVFGAGFLGGLAVASYREWLLVAVAFLAGCAVAWLVHNLRAAKAKAAELLEGRERRANVNAALRRRASERADARLSLQRAKADRLAAISGPGELPEDF